MSDFYSKALDKAKNRKPKSSSFNFKFEDDLKSQLLEICKKEGITLSKILNELVRESIKEYQELNNS